MGVGGAPFFKRGTDMRNSLTTVFSLLTWQQEGRLLRDRDRNERVVNDEEVIPLSAVMSRSQFSECVGRLAAFEDALRVTDLSLSSGTSRLSTEFELPITYVDASSEDEVDHIAQEKGGCKFDRYGAPLWAMTLISYRDARGTPRQCVFVSFDRLISDGRTWDLLVSWLSGVSTASRSLPGRSYRDWASLQRRMFPSPHDPSSNKYREFWMRHLDGTPADRASTPRPMSTSSRDSSSGVVRSLYRRLPDRASLSQAAARYGTSPFVLILSGVASAISQVSGQDDITVRVNTSGRLPEFYDTMGLFSDSIPIRIRSSSLADPQVAIGVVSDLWLGTYEYQITPWDYILGLDRDSSLLSVPSSQILINFVPYNLGDIDAVNMVEETTVGDISSIQLIVRFGQEGQCYLGCSYDPGVFYGDGMYEFVDCIALFISSLSSQV